MIELYFGIKLAVCVISMVATAVYIIYLCFERKGDHKNAKHNKKNITEKR